MEVFGENLTYQWYFKDKGAEKFTLTNSFKGNTYSVAMTEARDGRQIYCVITSDRGKSVQTKTVILSTPQPLQILEQTPVDLYTHYGASVELFVEAFGGTPPYDYRWEYHSDEMEAGQWKYWEEDASDAFSVYAYHLYKNYIFRCIITDADGNQITSDVIRLRPDRPGIYEGPDADDAYVELGAPINLQVLAYGENLTYQWYVKAADAETFVADPANTGNLYATISGSTAMPVRANGRISPMELRVRCVARLVPWRFATAVSSAALSLPTAVRFIPRFLR